MKKCFGRWSDVCKEDCHCEKSDEDLCFAAENEMEGVVIVVRERCPSCFGSWRKAVCGSGGENSDGRGLCPDEPECWLTMMDAQDCVIVVEEENE